MPNELNGRTVVNLQGQDPYVDTLAIRDALAEMSDIYDQDGRIMLIDQAGEFVPVTGAVLCELVRTRIVTRRAACRDGRWRTEYSPVELDVPTMRNLLGWNDACSLVKRLPKA